MLWLQKDILFKMGIQHVQHKARFSKIPTWYNFPTWRKFLRTGKNYLIRIFSTMYLFFLLLLFNGWNKYIVLLGNFLNQGAELPQANYIWYKIASYCLVPSIKCKQSLNKNQKHMVPFRSQNSSSKSDKRNGEMKYVSKTYFSAGERVSKSGERWVRVKWWEEILKRGGKKEAGEVSPLKCPTFHFE